MKYLILLLLSFSAYGNYEIEIKMPGFSSMGIRCEDLAKCKDKLIKWADKNKVYQSEWKDKDTGFGVSKTIEDENGSREIYLKPLNYSFEFKNISAEIQADEARKARKDELKSKGQNLNIKELIELLEIKGII